MAKFPKENFPVFYELTGGVAIENVARSLKDEEVFKNTESLGSNQALNVLWRFFDECRLMADAREILRKIARRSSLRKGKITPSFNVTGDPFQVSNHGVQLYHRLVVNADGLLEARSSRSGRALIEVEAFRIRLCQNCGKIY